MAPFNLRLNVIDACFKNPLTFKRLYYLVITDNRFAPEMTPQVFGRKLAALVKKGLVKIDDGTVYGKKGRYFVDESVYRD